MNTDKVRELQGLLERIASLHYAYKKGSYEEQEKLQPQIKDLRTYLIKQIERVYKTEDVVSIF